MVKVAESFDPMRSPTKVKGSANPERSDQRIVPFRESRQEATIGTTGNVQVPSEFITPDAVTGIHTGIATAAMRLALESDTCPNRRSSFEITAQTAPIAGADAKKMLD